jgi:glycosyltransferase involved in cell wall biosynthesis
MPQKLRWGIKNIFLKKSIDAYVEKRKIENAYKKCHKGINLIGAIRAEMGLGQSCRLLANMIIKCNYKLSIYDMEFNDNVKKGDVGFDAYVSDAFPYGINIFHVNPIEIGRVFMKIPEAWEGRYNIAFWLWELEEFPKEWILYCNLFDEIWAPSKFTADSIRKVTDVPVRVIPYFVTVSHQGKLLRKDFGLPEDKFLFLSMFDMNSTLGRKNPMGAIKAFKYAFSPEDSRVGMVFKINNTTKDSLVKLRDELKGYDNIYFITETLGKDEVNCLIESVDAFVSLHRSEGFGLVMAEAMLLGTPVIATNWSSNTEFMDKSVSCMVDYKLIRNPKREDLYPKGCVWAESEYRQAAEYMVKLAGNEDYCRWIGKSAKQFIESKLGKGNTVDVLGQELDRVWMWINTKLEL